MTKLKEKTTELSKTIMETEEYKKFEEASKNFKEDKEASKLFNDFQKARNELNILEHGGFEDKGERKKFEKILMEVKKNEKINNWLSTQREFENLISQTAVELSNKLNFPFTLPKKCGGGCSC